MVLAVDRKVAALAQDASIKTLQSIGIEMSPYKKILVVVDSLEMPQRQLDRAIDLASKFDADLHVVDTVTDVSRAVRYLSHEYAHLNDLIQEETHTAVNELVKQCESRGVTATGKAIPGPNSVATSVESKRVGANMVVLRAKGKRSRASGFLGSTARKLIHDPPCDLWLSASGEPTSCKTIVAAVDATPDDPVHSKLNDRIITVSMQLSKFYGCRLLITYAWQLTEINLLKGRLPSAEYDRLELDYRRRQVEGFESLLVEHGLDATGPEARPISGEPCISIPALCDEEDAGLLVCGTVARHGLSGLFMGNTAERIIDRLSCNVLALVPENKS